MTVNSLSYIGLGVRDKDTWRKFAVDGLGMMEASSSDSSHRLRLDERAWRIALHDSDHNDILYAGFDLADTCAVDDVRAKLEAHAIECRALTSSELSERGVAGGVRALDPDGLALEFVYGAEFASSCFESPYVEQFVTGEGGLGHIVLSAKDPAASTEFYQVLGFAVSDYIDMTVGPDIVVRITFLHCNKRHHTLALAPMPGPRRVDHIMLEVDNVDDVIETYNRLMSQGLPMKRHLGRHTNDRMLSFYVTTPAEFDVEFGCDGVEIGDQWEVRTYDKISLWGHRPDLR